MGETNVTRPQGTRKRNRGRNLVGLGRNLKKKGVGWMEAQKGRSKERNRAFTSVGAGLPPDKLLISHRSRPRR